MRLISAVLVLGTCLMSVPVFGFTPKGPIVTEKQTTGGKPSAGYSGGLKQFGPELLFILYLTRDGSVRRTYRVPSYLRQRLSRLPLGTPITITSNSGLIASVDLSGDAQ